MNCHVILVFIVASVLILCNKLNGQQPIKTPVEQITAKQIKLIVPNLPPNHYQFWLKNHPRAYQEYQRICSQALHPLELTNLEYFQSLHENLTFEDPSYLRNLEYGKIILNKICKKIHTISRSCWGYENNCQAIYLMPECYGSKLSQAKTEQEQKVAWFNQADFGYILERRRELNKFCSPDKYSNDTVKSSLECTKYFRTCRGQNLFMRFNNIPKGGSLVTNSKQSLIKPGDIGGWNCDLQLKRIKEENGQRGELQSWFTELENYNLIQGEDPKDVCDITIERQAFIIKLDSPSNMYHYFCNFLNLYATFHLNNKFSDDNEIIIWDNHFPRSQFNQMWSVFSKNKPTSIENYDGKRVCFKKFIFTLMPRMLDGLYYNTPLVPGCSKTGLFDAFNKHVLHKLNINQDYDLKLHKQTDNKPIRITILSRSTPHRRVLNEKQLEQALSNHSADCRVQLVDYHKLDFNEQLRITQNSDILAGLHGAGLTHILFLPDWATVYEIYDCRDKCYHELARLRGVNHFTQRDSDKFLKKVQVEDTRELKRLSELKLVEDEKFSNYIVDVEAFLANIEKAIERMRKNRSKYFKDLEEKLKEEGVLTLQQTSQPKQQQPELEEPLLKPLNQSVQPDVQQELPPSQPSPSQLDESPQQYQEQTSPSPPPVSEPRVQPSQPPQPPQPQPTEQSPPSHLVEQQQSDQQPSPEKLESHVTEQELKQGSPESNELPSQPKQQPRPILLESEHHLSQIREPPQLAPNIPQQEVNSSEQHRSSPVLELAPAESQSKVEELTPPQLDQLLVNPSELQQPQHDTQTEQPSSKPVQQQEPTQPSQQSAQEPNVNSNQDFKMASLLSKEVGQLDVPKIKKKDYKKRQPRFFRKTIPTETKPVEVNSQPQGARQEL